MAACVMILLYIRYEQSYDRWLPDVENTYQFQAWYPHPQDGEPSLHADVGLHHRRRRLKKDFPQVERAVYFSDNEPVFVKDGQATATKKWWFADDDFLKVVSLPLLARSDLAAPETAVITQRRGAQAFWHRPGRRQDADHHLEGREARPQDHRPLEGFAQELEHEDQRDDPARLQSTSTRTHPHS